MNRTNDERLLDLRTLVRSRLERDLKVLADIAKGSPEVPLSELLDEIHHTYEHYLIQNALLDNAHNAIYRNDRKLKEEINSLRSIDS